MTTDFDAALWHKINTKTKPLGALGKLETLAAQIATVQGTLTPVMEHCHLTILAADHGIAEAGVSAYPQEVTRQMVLNFVGGGAAANVLARTLGLTLGVVNAGVRGGLFRLEGVEDRPIGEGTANALTTPAMTAAEFDDAMAAGRAITDATRADALAFGEMGIGNTSAACLIAHKLTGAPLNEIVGRGTGVDDAGLAQKRDVLSRAALRTSGDFGGDRALCEYGGYEIAMMTGAMIRAAELRKIILVDGFIATSAALAAARIAPEARQAMVFAHISAEPGHRAMLAALEADPLLDLGMRLGEGTGAALAWPIVKSAAAILNDMASFDSAGVSGPA